MKGLDDVVSSGQVVLKVLVICPREDALWTVHVWSRGLGWSWQRGQGIGVILESTGLGESVWIVCDGARKGPGPNCSKPQVRDPHGEQQGCERRSQRGKNKIRRVHHHHRARRAVAQQLSCPLGPAARSRQYARAPQRSSEDLLLTCAQVPGVHLDLVNILLKHFKSKELGMVHLCQTLLGDGTRWSARACWVYDMAARGPSGRMPLCADHGGSQTPVAERGGVGEAGTVRADVFWENVWA